MSVATHSSPVRAFFATYSASSSEDDSKVDYTSMLGEEERRQRFSEEVVDKDLKDSVMVQKMYRQLQRQVYCGLRNKVPPYSNTTHQCSTDHHLNEWLEKKRLQDTRRKAAKMAMLAREANVQQAWIETVGKEKMAYKGKENNSEFDFNINNRDHERFDIIVECEDEESLARGSNFQTEPLRSRTVSFTIPTCSEVLGERQPRSSKENRRSNVIVTSGGLIFMLIAAALVTATFLMSPVIESIFLVKIANDSLTNAKDGDISEELAENIDDYKTA